MKDILIIHSNMYLGGAETSLLGLLDSLDYSQVRVDLLLMDHSGELLPFLSDKVNLLPENKKYHCMYIKIKDALKQGKFDIALARLFGKIAADGAAKANHIKNSGYLIKQYCFRYAQSMLPGIRKRYDLAISFMDPHYMLARGVNAAMKLAWLHTDFKTIDIIKKHDYRMWNACNYDICVSESCRESLVRKHPELKDKALVIENILSPAFVSRRAEETQDEIKRGEYTALLSIGRFTNAKNFDNVPEICREILAEGLPVKWYLIGFGGEEGMIREKIGQAHMENHVIILGKKENPYPYIKACDIYIQPSRFEGKSVAVREAQMLGKPVVITKFGTSSDQLEDAVDGIIVPLDNKGCAKGIGNLIRDKKKQNELIRNCRMRDYSNRSEMNKLMELLR